MSESDPLTVAAIAVLVYMLALLIHEGVGHGATCALVGGRVLTVSSVQCQCDVEGLTRSRERSVEAAGTIANLVFGLLFFAALISCTAASPVARYFLWLSAMVNLLQAGGYLMLSPFLGFGDWAAFLDGLRRAFAWKLALTALGLLISFAALEFGRLALEPFCGASNPVRSRQAWLLTAWPYAVGGIVSCAVAFLHPASRALVLTSAAAATFGGTSWLLWIGYLTTRLPPATTEGPLVIAGQPALMAAGLAALVFWALAFAPGIHLGSR